MRIKKYIDFSTQHDDEVETAIKVNKESGYEYLLREESNLIDAGGVKMLLRFGYSIDAYGDDEYIVYRHKNYNADKERIDKANE